MKTINHDGKRWKRKQLTEQMQESLQDDYFKLTTVMVLYGEGHSIVEDLRTEIFCKYYEEVK